VRYYLVLLSWLIASTTVSWAAEVFVRAGNQTGVGLLRPHEGNCFVITPLHVIRVSPDDIQADDIEVVGSDGSTGLAVLIKEQKPDLAVLRLKKQNVDMCSGAGWPTNIDMSNLLDTNVSGFVEGRTEAGSQFRFEVSLEDRDSSYVIITPRNADRKFSKGQSGSAVIIQGVLAAMLFETQARRGTAIRIDRIDALVGDIFSKSRLCRDLCETSTKGLVKESQYDFACLGGPMLIACKMREDVFALPSEWPVPRYLHVVVMSIGDRGPQVVSITLSTSKQKGSIEVIMNGAGRFMGVSNLKGAICLVEVGETSIEDNDFSIQVKNCMYTER
jgi:hypothetical protein